MITKIISGGQIGADIAGLRAAKRLTNKSFKSKGITRYEISSVS